MKVEDDDSDNKPVTDKDADFHKKQVLQKLVVVFQLQTSLQ